MKKARVRVGGGSRGKLIYYGYTIYGDRWGRICRSYGYGYRFLPRRDKTGLTPYLYGLKATLKKIVDEADNQYELIYYCSDRRLYQLLSSWGSGYRDKMIIDLLNEVRSLSNSIGYLRIVDSRITSGEAMLRKNAWNRFMEDVEEVFRKSRSWITSEDGYLVYVFDEPAKHIPLEYLSTVSMRREKGIGGIILLRRSGTVTKLFYHSLNSSKEIIDSLKNMDPGFIREWRGTYRCLYITRSSLEDIENVLLEVSSQWLMD